MQRVVGLLLAAGTVLALAAWPPTRGDARVLVVPGLALAGWAVLDAALLGVPPAGAIGLASLVLGVVAVLVVCRRLSVEDREFLLTGVLVAGVLVALAGWLGVAVRVTAWAWEGDGIWRASATLTYPNAAAAVLVPLALLVLARLIEMPRSGAGAGATVLLTGVGATLSRAGALGLAVGLVVLAGLRGPAPTARAAAGPCRGCAGRAGLGCCRRCWPRGRRGRRWRWSAWGRAGLAVAAGLARPPRRRWSGLARGAAARRPGARSFGGAAASRSARSRRRGSPSPRPTGPARCAPRSGCRCASGDRGRSRTGPPTREGAGRCHSNFRYAHNEYIQVAAELGLVGLSLLAILLVALGRLLWSARATSPMPRPVGAGRGDRSVRRAQRL